MNKMQMAHEWAMNTINAGYCNETKLMVKEAWAYADAMQAEADKREHKHMFLNGGPCICGVTMQDAANKIGDINNWVEIRGEGEWQPDWSQAPEWAKWWSVDENGTANFSGKKPHIEGHQWVYYSAAGEKPCHIEAPSFNYQGNWKNSLRKRPQ